MGSMLDAKETELFCILVGLLGEDEQERGALRVKVAAKGSELGRAYKRLYDRGLLEERTFRPGFIRRLFGAQETRWVRLSGKGQDLATKLFSVDLRYGERAAALTDHPQLQPTLPDLEDAAEEDLSLEPIVDLQPALLTEATLESRAAESISASASERIDGIAELLGLLGFDLTEAGRSLASSRWSENFSDGEVALEILTTSLAHAAKLRARRELAIDTVVADTLIGEIDEVFKVFVAEGMVEAGQQQEAVRAMRSFLLGRVDSPELALYLVDPLRGRASPAAWPENIGFMANA